MVGSLAYSRAIMRAVSPRPGRSRARRAPPSRAPEPPEELPPGRVVHLRGLGELFVRDSGGSGVPVLLLHGWMFPADLNWFRCYKPLLDAGYRVVALDHRGHGRGLRSYEDFSLERCAGDAAALVEHLDCGPVLAVGYSMGGPIAQLMARHHPEQVRGLVLCATSREWRSPRLRLFWNAMAALRLVLNLFPYSAWRRALRAAGFPDSATTSWVTAELTRGSGRDIAEAGRELGRFDSRRWVGSLSVPAAVVLTRRDTAVPPAKQAALAADLGAPIFESDGDHAVVTARPEAFVPALLSAVASVLSRAERSAAAA